MAGIGCYDRSVALRPDFSVWARWLPAILSNPESFRFSAKRVNDVLFLGSAVEPGKLRFDASVWQRSSQIIFRHAVSWSAGCAAKSLPVWNGWMY